MTGVQTCALPICRLYPGEIVERVEALTAEDGSLWVEIALGADAVGYVPAEKLQPAGWFRRSRWRKTEIVRDERPLGMGLRGLGETYGASLNVRYLPLTRLGMTLGVGPVLESFVPKGTALTVGFLFFGSTRNLSPYIDIDVTRLSYHDSRTKLQITALAITAGLEWMASWGGYLAAGVTYLRSMDISIVVKYDDARAGSTSAGQYGFFDEMLDGELFQAVAPSFTVGYGF